MPDTQVADLHASTRLPLDRIVVLDLTLARAGPTCVRHLADWGADVIRIEPPDQGGEEISGDRDGPDFQNLHRNKRMVQLNLKSAAGHAAFMKLVATADVIVENMRANVKHKLKISWDDVHAVNPRLVYGSISGFGQTGPYSARAGVDQIAQGMGGLMSITGLPGQGPVRVGIPIADLTAGNLLAFGIMTAIEARHRTGRGQMVETSLLEAAIAFGVYEAAHYAAHGTRPERIGQAHRGSSPYQCLATSDGYITVGGSQQNLWKRLLVVLGLPDLEDDARFKTNADRVKHNDILVGIIEKVLVGKPKAHWLAEMEKAGIPAGPVLAYDEVFTDPHVLARDMWVATEHSKAGKFNTIGVPVKLSETPGAVRSAAPALGQHNGEVLAALAAAAKRKS